jgi:hypothetical protein
MATPVTPATAGITAIPDPKRSPQSYQAYVTAQNEKASADALEKSNAQIQSGFQPILDFYKKQETDTSARYAKNTANLTSIFGALSGISAKDTTNINNQFASSITKQQADLATRTAEQRAAQTAGAAQAVATGAERGNGPALKGSPTATATEQAIGQSNAIQTNWEGLMNAQKMNAATDIANRGAGYGQQEVAAQAQLTQNLQEALANIGGQQASLQGQIAQAKVARDQALQEGQADAAAAQQKQIDAMELQASKNAGIENVAKIRASAKSSGGGTSTTKKTTYKNTSLDFKQQLLDSGLPPAQANQFVSEIGSVERQAVNGGTKKQVWDGTKYITVSAPLTGAQAYQLWATKYAGQKNADGSLKYGDLVDYAKHYFYDIYEK